MKKGLVLAGGGTRGAYQNGAVRALRELREDDWNIVTGTSIGALNAALVVQKDYEAMDDLWKNLTQDKIINGPFIDQFDLSSIINERNLFASFFKSYVKEKGADVTPLKNRILELYSPERFFASDIDFGCVTVHHINQKPELITKEMMREHGRDWLLASSSAFPAFPVATVDGQEYVDGGYFDNLPIDLAMQMGAEKLVVIDLNSTPQHPGYIDKEGIAYLFPTIPTGSFLDFSRDTLDMLDIVGYNDTMKYFGKYRGVRYTFYRESLPSYVPEFVRQLMMLDTRIKIATNINERFRSENVIIDWLESLQHRKIQKHRQIFYGLLDQLMDMCGFDVKKIYTYKEVRDEILKSFANCAFEDYPYQVSLSPIDFLGTAKDSRAVVERMIHVAFYPDHIILPESIVLTVYPHEKAMAEMVLCMMKELGEE